MFIKGGAEGNGEAVYTHGNYYANVKAALAALQNQVDGLSYFRGIKKAGAAETAWAADKDGVITFSSTDPASVDVNISSKGVEIGLSKTFTDTVAANTAAIEAEATRATAAEGKIRTDLGQKEDAASAEGSAFARIAQVKSDLSALQNTGVGAQIQAAIEGLDAEKENSSAHVTVKVVEVDGKIDSVSVSESDIASASIVEKAIEDEAKAREDADKALADRLDIIEGEAEGSIKKAVADEKSRAEGAEAALAGRLDVIEGEDEGSIKKAVADAKAELLGDAAEDYNTLGKLEDKIQAVEGAAKSYEVKAINVENEENVKEAWGLFDEDGVQAGSTIKIYKDSSLKEVELDGQILKFTYILADGSESTVGVDVSAFLHESEYGNGLQVIDHIVSVKMDEASESFLSVGANGIKLSGIQAAIDAEAAARQRDIEAEAARADAAEKANASAIAAEKQRAEAKEAELAQAIATGNSDTLTDAKKYTDDEIAKLDVEDAAVENQFVTAVSETDGKISVSRSSINASQIGITNTENDAFAVETQNVQDALTELANFWAWEEL